MSTQQKIKRKPLAAGNVYGFGPMYPGAGFRVTSVEFRGRVGYDGGAQGVGIKWLYGTKRGEFHLVKSEEAFWNILTVRYAIDAEVE
jgi:hypothetical protein